MAHRSLQNRRKVYHQAGRMREEEQANQQQTLSKETIKPKIEVKETDVAGVIATVGAVKSRNKK